MKNHLILPLLFLLLTGTAVSQNKSDEFLTRVLAADGVTAPEDIQKYRSIYDKILQEAKEGIDPGDKEYNKNEDLFNFLHGSYLKKYTEESRFVRLLEAKEYNCITSVILFYLLSTDIGTEIALNKSPFHVYITAMDEGREYIIELTDPSEGFDYEWDKDNYAEELLRYKIITREELEKNGASAIYSEYVAQSHKISPTALLAAYYSNLSIYALKQKNNREAYRLIKKAVILNPDSLNIIKHNLIWAVRILDEGNNTDSLTALLLASMDTIPASDKFREAMISGSGLVIEQNLDNKHFDTADSIYRKLCSVLPGEKAAGKEVKELYLMINTEKARSYGVRGEFDAAYAVMSDLIKTFPGNQNVLELYIWIGAGYLNQLTGRGEYDKVTEAAETIFNNAPGVQSVKDNYAQAVASQVLRTSMYRTDSRRARKLLLSAYKRVPDNYMLKQALATVYHELAMAEIRNKEYRKAVDLLNEGLKYDPDNYDLKKELIWTKELIK